MDSRDTEPRDAAWGRVSEQFASLGETLRRRYEEQDVETPAQTDSRETVQDALRSLGDAAERLATTVGSIVRDAEVQQEARTAASSLVDALSMTFSRLTDDVRRRMDRPSQGADDSAWDTAPPPAEIEESSESRPEVPPS